jgi:BlaI family transcriptional regulator, penicillinase repressor
LKPANLGKLELQVMQAVWELGRCSVREIQEGFPQKKRPAYTTIQTVVSRLEAKGALRRVRKISNAYIFEAAVSREITQKRVLDDLLGLFGGRSQTVMAHLIESGKLTLDDLREAEKMLAEPSRRKKT